MKHPSELFANMAIAIKEVIVTQPFISDSVGVPARGYSVLFENGRVLSLQAHPFCYTSNRSYETHWLNVIAVNGVSNWYDIAFSIEIATWVNGSSGLQKMPSGDTVMGYVEEDALIRFMTILLYADYVNECPIPILGD